MKIISHGKWSKYTPDPWPVGLPKNIKFVKRHNDDIDWYSYKNDPTNFGSNSIFMSCYYMDYKKAFVVSPSVDDITMLFPNDQYIIEVTDYSGDPQVDFEGKVYNPETNSVCLQ